MTSVYIPFYGDNETDYLLPLEGFIVAFVSQWLSPEVNDDPPTFNMVLVPQHIPILKLPKSCIKSFQITETTVDDMPDTMKMTTLPSIMTSCRQLCISGLCSVLRFLLKSDKREKCNALLGFRKGCLMACAEVSVWTKFCEIDLLSATKTFLSEYKLNEKSSVPVDVCRFEVHLNEPLRTHNIGKEKYKVIKDLEKMKLRDHSEISEKSADYVSTNCVPNHTLPEQTDVIESTPVISYNPACVTGKMGARILDLPILKHEYAESTSMTLADLIILVYIHQILERMPEVCKSMRKTLPGIHQWYTRVLTEENVVSAMSATGLQLLTFGSDQVHCTVDVPVLRESGLFIRDPKSYARRIRTFTNQNHIEAVFKKLKIAKIAPEYLESRKDESGKLDWSKLPAVVLPTFGNLPASRFERKCLQLENMAVSVCSFAKDGDVIVDFCSGGGHLGILLAHQLPKCRVVMVENKEESIGRALLRARSLPNACIYQCNMAYFRGKFDIGVALHACGVATDLVLHLCLQVGAAFVVSPCCYGSMHNTNLINYPVSSQFSGAGITTQEYYILGHAADQTHEKGHKNDQGKYCMGLVDTDRGLQASALGYKVSLLSMTPLTCSPKNNMIVGIKTSE